MLDIWTRVEHRIHIWLEVSVLQSFWDSLGELMKTSYAMLIKLIPVYFYKFSKIAYGKGLWLMLKQIDLFYLV